jgi:hypothetical protein
LRNVDASLAHFVLVNGLKRARFTLECDLNRDIQVARIARVWRARQLALNRFAFLDGNRILEIENRLLPKRNEPSYGIAPMRVTRVRAGGKLNGFVAKAK